jgi:nucleotide-binding universal stress UspA family protein
MLHMFKTILAAVDGSPRAPEVIRASVEIADRFDARVHLFRAVVVPQEFPAAAPNPPDDVPRLLEAEAHTALRELARVSPRVTVEPPDLSTPQAWRAILRAAARINADLIVIGSHGYHGWDRILGTTASKVADHADRCVLVVHPCSPTQTAGGHF